jgi:hypothetical protein
MNLKNFIIASVVSLCALPSLACVDSFTPSACYMFSVYNRNTLTADSVRLKNIAFWHSFCNGRVGDGQIEKALYGSTDNEGAKGISLLGYLRQQKNADALCYLGLLKQMSAISGADDGWNYPSKRELLRHKAVWGTLLTSATTRIAKSKNLSGRYWLMAMRAAFYTGNKMRCQQLWNTYEGRFRGSYLHDVAEGYLANYWYKSGQKERAREFYARTGDLKSLRWCICNDISLQGIKKLYAETPNSVAFPYLIQDYVNCMDAQADPTNQWYDTPAKAAEARKAMQQEMTGFQQFAGRVLSEGKAGNPMLWQTAAAYMAYLQGNNADALSKFDLAEKMTGTPRMKDNLRAIRFLVRATEKSYPSTFDSYALGELRWLQAMIKAEPVYTDWYAFRNHYLDVLRRVVYAQLTPRYMASGNFATAAALTGMTDRYDTNGNTVSVVPVIDVNRTTDKFSWEYSSRLFEMLDTADVRDAEAYVRLLDKPAEAGALSQYAASGCYRNADYYAELLGTKYMRLQQFDKALSYFQRVSTGYVAHMNIAPYLWRGCDHPLWFNYLHQKQLAGQRYVTSLLTTNPKLAYCEEMMRLQQQADKAAPGADKAETCYQLAIRYAQASSKGDCWAYLSYGWSSEPRYMNTYGKEHFGEQAVQLLQQALDADASDDNQVRCLFALAALSTTPWRTVEYDSSYKEVTVLHDAELQGKSFAALRSYRQNAAFGKYQLGRCDNLKMYFDRKMN